MTSELSKITLSFLKNQVQDLVLFCQIKREGKLNISEKDFLLIQMHRKA